MNKDNKYTEVDNTDKKLHISDVSDSSSTQMWKDIMTLNLKNNRIWKSAIMIYYTKLCGIHMKKLKNQIF